MSKLSAKCSNLWRLPGNFLKVKQLCGMYIIFWIKILFLKNLRIRFLKEYLESKMLIIVRKWPNLRSVRPSNVMKVKSEV